ncbi:hypothetical protein MKEN_00188600 [Mycena kentingensis (nom. inval.)]|nr:hypothetical protein MKEN_00188600 [Mycena kentingensis (nom. inval.)]
MHRLFLIDELMFRIFALILGSDWLLNLLEPYSGRRTVARLARTCKTFEQPALDVLWRFQRTLDNILKCLPPSVWEMRQGNRDNGWVGGIRIVQPVTIEQWARARTYARRVRILDLDWALLSPDNSCFKAMQSCQVLTGELLFPGLQEINCNIVPYGYEEILFASGPTVHSVRMPEHIVNTPFLRPLCSILKVLTLLPEDTRTTTTAQVSELCLLLTDIQHLQVPDLDAAALRHVSQLPSLLGLYLFMDDISAFGSIPSGDLPFPNLGSLQFYRSTIDFAEHFLQRLAPGRPISELKVETRVPAKVDAMRRLYATIGDRVIPSTLEKLYIGNWTEDGHNPTPAPPRSAIREYLVDEDAMRPLLQFSQMRELTLHTPAGFCFGDETALSIAEAFQNITELALTSGTTLHSNIPNLTLNSLWAFRIFCRQLRSLSVELDASVNVLLPTQFAAPLGQPGASAWRLGISLNVEISPIYGSKAVARFLLSLYGERAPRITMADEWRWDDPDGLDVLLEDDEELDFIHDARSYYKTWTAVNRLLRSPDRTWLDADDDDESDEESGDDMWGEDGWSEADE